MGPDRCLWVVLRWFRGDGAERHGAGGATHEYEVFGLGLPNVLLALLVGMAVSAALPWAHYKRESYTAFEETFYGVLLGISAFGLIMVVPLVLST